MSVTVVSPSAASNLTTVAAVLTRFNMTASVEQNAKVEALIRAASSKAAVFCRRQFGRQTIRERVRISNNPESIFLSRGPAYRIVSVRANGEDFDVDEIETDGNKVWCLDDNGEQVPWYGRDVTIIYEAGFLLPGELRKDRNGVVLTAAPDLPADIEEAVLQLIGAAVSSAGRSDPMAKAEESEGVGRTEFYVQGARAMLGHPEAESTLAGWRWANIG